MTALILSGEAIVTAAETVTEHPWGWETPAGRYPRVAGVTGVADADLPPGFEPARYAWRGGALVEVAAPGVPQGAAAAAVERIEAGKQALLARGAPYKGRRVAVDAQGRTDLSGLAVTASLVLAGALSDWPEAYAQGWICLDNTRVPLPTPAEGVALGAACADWYAQVIQHARDAKDAALASVDPDAVAAACDWSEFDAA